MRRGPGWHVFAAALTLLLIILGLALLIRTLMLAPARGTGDGPTPTPTPTATPSPLPPTPTRTRTPTSTPTPTPSSTPTATPTPTPTATATPTPTPSPTLAPRVMLGPFGHEWQTWNNCGPAALAIALSYFDVERTQADIAAVLRPHPDDKNVSFDELLRYAADVGVLGRVRVNGDLDLLRRLNNAGIPVLTAGWLRVGEDIGHYRVVRGYDLATGELLTQDSYHGPDRWVTAEDFLAMWHPFFYAYAPLYRAEQEPLVAALVGADWDDEAMAARALADAEAAVAAAPDDPYAWYNLGDAHFLRGDFEAAVAAYERSVEIGLPPRFFWYQFKFFTALNATGQHERVLELTALLVAEAPGLAELHIERGHAFRALGRREEAIAAYEQALLYAPDREDVRLIVAELQS